MTQPTPEDAKVASEKAEKAEKARAAAKVDLLTVGHFVHHDHILGGDHDRYGVVTEVRDGVLTVRPLADHELDVAAGEFTPLTPDDIAG